MLFSLWVVEFFGALPYLIRGLALVAYFNSGCILREGDATLVYRISGVGEARLSNVLIVLPADGETVLNWRIANLQGYAVEFAYCSLIVFGFIENILIVGGRYRCRGHRRGTACRSNK